MAIYEVGSEKLAELAPSSFTGNNLRERSDLQRLFRNQIEVISPDTLMLGEEFAQWDDSRLRIDLLGLDRQANLVVIELKRTEDGGLMELQAIRYAAMASTMTFEQAVAARGKFLSDNRLQGDAQAQILEFLGWSEPVEEQFAQDTRIVLVSQGFSKELKTAALWLNEHGLDIRCIEIKPLGHNERVIVDVRQIIPQPEIEDYQIRVRTKLQKQRLSRKSGTRRGTFEISINGKVIPNQTKGRSVLVIVRELIANGVSPLELERIAEGCSRYFWFQLDEDIDPAAFVDRAQKHAERNRRSFDPIRWFCSAEDVIRSGGRTYALSTQWGSPGWDEMMSRLKDSFPQYGINITSSEDGTGV